jgi:hypothetical protein
MTIAAAAMTTEFVIAGLTRNPVHAYHWIPDVETPDLIRGRDDSHRVRDDSHESGMTIAAAAMTNQFVIASPACHCGPDPQSSACLPLDPGSSPG